MALPAGPRSDCRRENRTPEERLKRSAGAPPARSGLRERSSEHRGELRGDHEVTVELEPLLSE
jgi:hypothetical protein